MLSNGNSKLGGKMSLRISELKPAFKSMRGFVCLIFTNPLVRPRVKSSLQWLLKICIFMTGTATFKTKDGFFFQLKSAQDYIINKGNAALISRK